MPFEIPNYTLLRKLGEGAMAEVWLAEHKRNGRKAAIKVLKPAALADADFEKLFLREGQVLAGFDHPNIVRIYDNDRVGDLAYLVMEHLSGGTLAERMQRRPATIGEAIGLVVQIAGALDAAHRQQVIHRDLKPANIMLRDETTPVLTDFGAVRLLDRSTIYGRDGMIVGTPSYMSPEQIQGQTLGGSSDLYALGVLFFELLTGDRPFPGVSFPEIAAQHLYAPIPKLPASIAMLQPVLDRLLAKKPEDRYATATAFIDELRAIFIHDDALRQQVGYAGNSSAWSTQLRALGFVLDREQKVEVRIAQGEFLRGQASAVEPAPARPPEASADALARAAATIAAAGSPSPRAAAAWRGKLVAGVLVLSAVAAAGWWWSQLDAGSMAAGGDSQLDRAKPSADPAPPPSAPPGDDDAAAPVRGSDADEAGSAREQAEQAVAALELRSRYAALDDNSVLDLKTGLQWAGTDNGADIDWYDALKYCAEMGRNWRLPAPNELISLYDETGTFKRQCGEVVCSVTPLLRITAGFHWTRSEDDAMHSWVVDLNNGARQSMAIINPFHIRALCVREGPKKE